MSKIVIIIIETKKESHTHTPLTHCRDRKIKTMKKKTLSMSLNSFTKCISKHKVLFMFNIVRLTCYNDAWCLCIAILPSTPCILDIL